MDGMPQPNDNHRKLARLAGTWKGEEKMRFSPAGPDGVAIGTSVTRIDIDGLFAIQEYVQEMNGKTVYRGHGIFGWDDVQKNFTWYWVDSMGSVPMGPSRGQWDGDTLTLEHPPMGDKRGRYTFGFPDENTQTFTIENSQDGGKTWHKFLDGTYKRV